MPKRGDIYHRKDDPDELVVVGHVNVENGKTYISVAEANRATDRILLHSVFDATYEIRPPQWKRKLIRLWQSIMRRFSR